MPGLRWLLFVCIISLRCIVAADYKAGFEVSVADANRFISLSLELSQTVRNAWRETVTFPQLTMSYLLAAKVFPDRQEFENFAGSSRYWNPQKTISQLQWVPAVSEANKAGKIHGRCQQPIRQINAQHA